MATKQPTKKAEKNYSSRVRKLDYKSKKKVVKTSKPIPGSFSIMKASLKLLWSRKRLFLGILFVYALMYLLLVKGLAANFKLGDTKQALEDSFGSDIGTLEMGATLFGVLVGTSGSGSSETASVYQMFLFIVFSLAIIWALRQVYGSNNKISLRQVFYSSMYPFIQYIAVWLVIILQLLPALFGLTVYGIIVRNGIAVGWFEQLLWLLVLFILLGASVFFISSSLFASYIVTLPGLTPLTALRKARSLVKFRRFLIIRKVLFLPLAIMLFMIIVFVPLAIYLTVAAEVLFLIFSLSLLLISHTYFYTLYKALI